jgi:hypothetical protein
MKTEIKDAPEIRAKRAAAYAAGKYRFSPPPVFSGNWDAEAWCNWVVFDDPDLNGFLPYTKGAK